MWVFSVLKFYWIESVYSVLDLGEFICLSEANGQLKKCVCFPWKELIECHLKYPACPLHFCSQLTAQVSPLPDGPCCCPRAPIVTLGSSPPILWLPTSVQDCLPCSLCITLKAISGTRQHSGCSVGVGTMWRDPRVYWWLKILKEGLGEEKPTPQGTTRASISCRCQMLMVEEIYSE